MSRNSQETEHFVEVIPSIASILSDSLQCLGYEVARLKDKSKAQPLDNYERRSLVDLVKALPVITIEQEKLRKQDLIGQLTSEQLVALAQKLLPTTTGEEDGRQ